MKRLNYEALAQTVGELVLEGGRVLIGAALVFGAAMLWVALFR